MGKSKSATNNESLGCPLVIFQHFERLEVGKKYIKQTLELFSGFSYVPCFLLDSHSKGKPGLTRAMELHFTVWV